MIDAKDKQIMDLLIDNSRQSFRNLAKKMGCSVVTVMKRVKKLEMEKIIKGYSVILDYDKLGYDIDVLINVKIAHGKFFDVHRQIQNNPSVVSIYDVTGDFDAVIIAKFKNRRNLDVFLKKLQALDHVDSTHTVFVLNVQLNRSVKLAS